MNSVIVYVVKSVLVEQKHLFWRSGVLILWLELVAEGIL